MRDPVTLLRQCGVQPTPQRLAVVLFVLASKQHPTADDVLTAVKKTCPTISRATVYNTLNMLVARGLLRTQILKEGTVVFDPHVDRHHHFIDDDTGKIYDLPWAALKISGGKLLGEYEIREYQVVLRGRKRRK